MFCMTKKRKIVKKTKVKKMYYPKEYALLKDSRQYDFGLMILEDNL